MRGKIQNQLDEVGKAIDGALNNPKIMAKLEKHGYNQKVLKDGRAQIEKVKMCATLQDEGNGLQKTSTQQLQETRQQIHTLYLRHLTIARVALSLQPGLWDVLKLKGPRKKDFSGWKGQVQAFYQHAPRVQELLEKHGISAGEIAQVQAMIDSLGTYRVQQLKGKSDRQSATQQRRKEIKALQEWMRDFLYIARHALRDDKQQLEALGQVV